jgi:hypothetical protein
VRPPSFVGRGHAQRRNPDLVRGRFPAFGYHRAIAEEANLDAVALDNRRRARFVEVAPGAGHGDPFLKQQRTGIEQCLRTVVEHVVIGDRHRIETAVGKDLRHLRRLTSVRRELARRAAQRVLALAVAESKVHGLKCRPHQLRVALDWESVLRAVNRTAIAGAQEGDFRGTHGFTFVSRTNFSHFATSA